MRNFLILFKHERRSLFPSARGKKRDVIGSLLSLIVTLVVVGVFALLAYSVAESYVTVKIDKISDPIARATELLNAIYSIIILALGIMCLEKMRTSLILNQTKTIFLRLPVKQSTLFLSKFAALLLWNYMTALFLILPVNAIFFFVLELGLEFWLNTLIVYLLLPMAAFLIATILLVPYIWIINFLNKRYFLMFITLSVLVSGAFLLYSELLSLLQDLFETGSIRRLFSHGFVSFLQALMGISYPANSLASIAFGENMLASVIISAAVAILALVLVFLVSRALYRLTLYRNTEGKAKSRTREIRPRTVLGSFMRKEFISVFRDPNHLFSYFAIAMSMPFMVYSCYTMFDTLIYNALGLTFEMALSLIVVLVFTILTNTFCATNVTRDGISALKAKIFPVKASKILLSKVLFCAIISSLSVLGSVLALYLAAGLSFDNALICLCIALVFSLSQIFMATRMDLNHAVVSASPAEIAKASDRTIAKTIFIGLIFAIIIGFLSLIVSVFAGNDALGDMFNIYIDASMIYIVPSVIAGIYFLISLIYYATKIEKSFENLVR